VLCGASVLTENGLDNRRAPARKDVGKVAPSSDDFNAAGGSLDTHRQAVTDSTQPHGFTKGATLPRSATRPLSLLLLIGAIAIGIAAPAQAFTPPIGSNKGSVITYNGHAGLGASVYQHNQTDLEFLALSPQGPGSDGLHDGTSNTVMFGEQRFAMPDMGGQY
jgi:hypothetical protein